MFGDATFLKDNKWKMLSKDGWAFYNVRRMLCTHYITEDYTKYISLQNKKEPSELCSLLTILMAEIMPAEDWRVMPAEDRFHSFKKKEKKN